MSSKTIINETLDTYDHVAGCIRGGTECDFDGWMCGDGRILENVHTFSQCQESAKNSNAAGFSFKGTHGGTCRTCTKNELRNLKSYRYWGTYAKSGTSSSKSNQPRWTNKKVLSRH